MRTFQVSELITRVRQAADIENDQHVTDTEIISLLNVYYPAFWDILIECAPPDYVSTTVDFNTVAGQLNYVLNTIAPTGDFYKIRHLYAVEQGGRYRPLSPVPEGMVQTFKPVAVAAAIHMLYIPSTPKLVLTTDTVDGYNGWEELLVMRAAASVRRKREEDSSILLGDAMRLEERIRKMSARDLAEPERVTRRRYRMTRYYWDNDNTQVDGYRVRGSNLELYTYDGNWGY